MQSYTLQELNGFVRAAIEHALPAQYWLTAELSQMSERGHMYCDFVQKADDGRTLATARGNCWQSTWRRLSLKFAEATGGRLTAGMQVMVMVRATFSEAYGFSYNIIDIEPSFTLGDMARRRREILMQLERDGIMHCNQQLALPRHLWRIAIVSARGAAGYGDFCHQLLCNPQRYRFCLTLFNSVMQGNAAPEGVLSALELIMARQDEFDAVVIIRGGGAVTDLACFDNYAIAQAIALFPLPVFTGIGHERDETVLDHVAHTRLKTPTAVAAWLIENADREGALLAQLQRAITGMAADRLLQERTRMETLSRTLPRLFGMVRERQEARIERMVQHMQYSVNTRINHERHRHEIVSQRLRQAAASLVQRQQSRLALLAQRLDSLDPARILERGYSMSTVDGHLLTSAKQAPKGSIITTRLKDGTLKSVVQ